MVSYLSTYFVLHRLDRSAGKATSYVLAVASKAICAQQLFVVLAGQAVCH